VKKLKRLLLALRVHSLGRTDSERFGLFGLWALGFRLRKTRFVLGLVLLALPLFFLTRANIAHVSALPSDNLNFQARLESSTGAIAPDGYYDIEFKLYNAATGGTSLWTETRSYNSGSGSCSGPLGTNDCRVRVANGYVSVYLGSVTSFPSTIPWDQQLYLTMNVGGTTSSGSITWDGEMNPRLKLTAVPYAMAAKNAEQIVKSNGSFLSTLSIQAPTGGDQMFLIPDQGAGGTYNVLTALSGTDGYVKLQGSTPGTQQTGHINVSGTGIFGGLLQGNTLNAGSSQQFQVDASGNVATSGSIRGASFDANGAISLSIGAVNATDIVLEENTALASGKTLTVSSGLTSLTGATSGDALVVSNSTSTGNILVLNDGSTPVVTIADEGATTFQNKTDSVAALQVKNAAGITIFNIDTTNSVVGTQATASPSTGSYMLNLRTGSTTGTTSNSGSINMQTGSVASGTSGDLSLEVGGSGTGSFGSVNIGTNYRANAINIGQVASNSIQSTVNIATATNGTQTVSIGSSNTAANATSIYGGATGGIRLQVGSGGTINLATNAVSQNVLIGNSTGGTIRVGQNGGTVQIDGTNFDVATNGVVTLQGGQTTDITTSGATTLRLDTGGAAAYFGTANANAVYLGRTGVTTTVAGSLSVTPQSSTSSTLLCSNGGVVSTCDASVIAPTAGNFVQNQNALQQATANFWISGVGRADTSLQAPAVDTATAVALNIGTVTASSVVLGKNSGSTATTIQSGSGGVAVTSTSAVDITSNGSTNISAGGESTWQTTSGNLTVQAAGTSTLTLQTGGAGTVNLGNQNSTTINIGSGSNIARTINIATGGTSQAQTVNIGSGNSSSVVNLASRTINIGSVGGASIVQGIAQTVPNTAGDGLTIRGSNGMGTGAGGAVTISGGNGGATSGANGGSLTLTGGTGTGTGVLGLVNLSTTAFASSATVSFGTSGTLNSFLAGAVNNYSSIRATATGTGYTLTIDAPTTATVGRILYISNNGTNDFNILLSGTSINIALKSNSTATLIWNGNGWTAAGASSATDLQAAYNNTLSSAGAAELVLNAPGGAADGLTIRNNGTPITGALFEVQSSIATNLFSVNNNTIEYAVNGGAENTTLTAWSNYNAGVTTKTTAAGTFATGLAGVNVATSATNQGAKNTLSTALPAGNYVVSFAAKLSSGGPSTFNIWYSANGTAQTAACNTSLPGTGYTISPNFTVSTSWTKVSCFIIVPSGGTATNAILIANLSNISFYLDNLSVISNAATTTPANVQIGGGATGGQPTLFTLDQFAGPPMSTTNAAYFGSMYYDTSIGAIQCYQSSGWGACGSAPDDIISMTPEYTGAVLNGTGVGTMTADFCANSAALTVGTLCSSNEARNFYKWTSPQATAQSYSIYVTYRLPSTFKSFKNGTMSLNGLTDSTTNAGVKYALFRKSQGGGVAQCSADTAALGSANTWTQIAPTTDITSSTCGVGQPNAFVAGDTLIIRITVNAQSNASAYVENLTFQYSNK
jgi:hypothetical protein